MDSLGLNTIQIYVFVFMSHCFSLFLFFYVCGLLAKIFLIKLIKMNSRNGNVNPLATEWKKYYTSACTLCKIFKFFFFQNKTILLYLIYTMLNHPHPLSMPLRRRNFNSDSFFPRATSFSKNLLRRCFSDQYNLYM